jgi:hypothetical protein
MGEFTELTISFTFVSETPTEVLMAFTPWRTGDSPPPLASLDELVSDDEQEEMAYEVEMQLYDDEAGETVASLSPTQRAAAWRALFSWGGCAYFPGPTFTELRWDPDSELWTLSARTVPKTSSEVVQALVSPLGAFAVEGLNGPPAQVGVITDEGEVGAVHIRSRGQVPFEFA